MFNAIFDWLPSHFARLGGLTFAILFCPAAGRSDGELPPMMLQRHGEATVQKLNDALDRLHGQGVPIRIAFGSDNKVMLPARFVPKAEKAGLIQYTQRPLFGMREVLVGTALSASMIG